MIEKTYTLMPEKYKILYHIDKKLKINILIKKLK